MLLEVLLLIVNSVKFHVEVLVVLVLEDCLFHHDLLGNLLEHIVNDLHVLDLLHLHVLRELVAFLQERLCLVHQLVERPDDIFRIFLQYKCYRILIRQMRATYLTLLF